MLYCRNVFLYDHKIIILSNEQTVYIRFFGNVNEVTVPKLINIVQEKFNAGIRKFVILISSGGGNVFYGLSAYNFLKGLPAEIIMHNFGSIDSSAGVIYCAGDKRYSVPEGRFLIHPVTWTYYGTVSLPEDQMEENIKSLRQDTENIASVIAKNTGNTKEKVLDDMSKRTNLDPEEAKKYGFVHEIKNDLVPDNVTILQVD